MRDLLKKILFFSILGLISCESFQRKPASFAEHVDLNQSTKLIALSIDRQKVESEKNEYQIKNKSQINSPEYIQNIQALDLKIDKIKAQINSLNKTVVSTFPTEHSKWNIDWRSSEQKLRIQNLTDFPLDKSRRPQRIQIMQNKQAKNYALEIDNQFLWQNKRTPASAKKTAVLNYLDAQISCDADFRITKPKFSVEYIRGSYASLKIYNNQQTADKVYLVPSLDASTCFIYLKDPNSSEESALRLISDRSSLVMGTAENIDSQIDECLLPQTNLLDGTEKLFLNNQYASLSCPTSSLDVEFIKNTTQEFQNMVEALYGRRLTETELKSKNSDLKLDFSKAPSLEAVYISSSELKNDFHGIIIERLLEYHAEQKASVKIIGQHFERNSNSKYSYYQSSKRFENFQIQEQNSKNGVNIFLTLSKNSEKNNLAILPSLKIQDQSFSNKIAADFLSFWNRDSKDFSVRSSHVSLKTSNESAPNDFEKSSYLIRHYFSTPFSELDSSQNIFDDLVRSSQKKVTIIVPHFKSNRAQLRTMQETLGRGVNITLITNIDHSSIQKKLLLTAKNSVYLKNLKIYNTHDLQNFSNKTIYLVDDRLAYIGSDNVSELENGTLIYNRSLSKKLNIEFEKLLNPNYLVDMKIKNQLFEKNQIQTNIAEQ